ncbi:MAG: hypothetical protein ACTSRG_18870 [Candidatus Helarchaeota archaeon]
MNKNDIKLTKILVTFALLSIILYNALEMAYSFRNPFTASINIIFIVLFGLILVAIWMPEFIELVWFLQ